MHRGSIDVYAASTGALDLDRLGWMVSVLASVNISATQHIDHHHVKIVETLSDSVLISIKICRHL